MKLLSFCIVLQFVADCQVLSAYNHRATVKMTRTSSFLGKVYKCFHCFVETWLIPEHWISLVSLRPSLYVFLHWVHDG